MSIGFTYILECTDGSYYTGSTKDIEKRLIEHQEGNGANHTKKRLPVALVYLEEFQRIDEAFNREKQIQGWSRIKKEALINGKDNKLPRLSIAYRDKLNTLKKMPNEVVEALETPKTKFNSKGKLLLTAEYVVLDGALALALPTVFKQSLTVTKNSKDTLHWKSYDETNTQWFEAKFNIRNDILLLETTDNAIAERLISIFKAVLDLNSSAKSKLIGVTVNTHQDFNRLWGLGTSSTLINNMANWLNVDAYQLLNATFGGSGYDIACAQHTTSITYQLQNGEPKVATTPFNPSFKEHLYFVYLNQKQNSRDGIASYKKHAKSNEGTLKVISEITSKIIGCKTLVEFCSLIEKHENCISALVNLKPVKKQLFNDFKGSIKSLGAWGGDFILVASEDNPTSYFKAKGYTTILPYSEMISH